MIIIYKNISEIEISAIVINNLNDKHLSLYNIMTDDCNKCMSSVDCVFSEYADPKSRYLENPIEVLINGGVYLNGECLLTGSDIKLSLFIASLAKNYGKNLNKIKSCI